MESTYETSPAFSYKEYFDSEYIGLSNDILNENMCIHRLLWEFQNILLSSAAILFRRFKRQWGAEYIQYYDEGYKNALSGRIITPKQDGLEKIFNECKWSDEFILIENEQKVKRLSRCVFIPVQIQFGSEDEMNNFCLLAFIKDWGIFQKKYASS